MQHELWVRANAAEHPIQFNSLDRAMAQAKTGTIIRLMPGRLELTTPLKKGVSLSGIGSGCMIVDKLGQLKDAPIKFITVIQNNGDKEYIRPEVNMEAIQAEAQLEAIARIMGKKDQYPKYVYDYRFKFGKLKGKTADYAIEKEPKYLQWLYNNVDELDPILEKIMANFSEEIGL